MEQTYYSPHALAGGKTKSTKFNRKTVFKLTSDKERTLPDVGLQKSAKWFRMLPTRAQVDDYNISTTKNKCHKKQCRGKLDSDIYFLTIVPDSSDNRST